MAFVIYLAQHVKAKWKRLVSRAAQHFDQSIVYDFCRLPAGLHNLLSAQKLQSYLATTRDGQCPGNPG
jgi:hypothetical protein